MLAMSTGAEVPPPLAAEHVTVLAQEAVDALRPQPGGRYVDGTFGGGGHSRLVAERLGATGALLCIDRDAGVRPAFDALAARAQGQLHFAHGSYADLERYTAELGWQRVDGVLLDLGFSSLQVDDPRRGFSFRLAGPLDMRYDQSRGQSAADVLASADEAELTRILFQYGEERQARRIARAIVAERARTPLETTEQLAALVERAVGGRRGAPIHPATRTFQALRIAVNDELGEVARGVTAALDLLAPGGRCVVIAFHSLEDRIVKTSFSDAARGCVCPRDAPVCVCGRTPSVTLIGRAARPSDAEVARNPRARSGIMRVAERLP
jgi:16S rRNA (cytosine1402-N4)-methyltransferase